MSVSLSVRPSPGPTKDKILQTRGLQTLIFYENSGAKYTNPDQRRTNFPQIQEPPQNPMRQKADMKQIPHCGPINIRRHRKKFIRHGDLALAICAPLI
jgi:hypothetical protein